MKRRILVLSVLVLSLFALDQPSSVASSTTGFDCNWTCAQNGQACHQRCDEEYAASPYPNPRWLMDCHDGCFWLEETCVWDC